MADHDEINPETDPFRPPDVPTEVSCLHCQQEYESYLIQWVQETVDGKMQGFWCCPTPDCDGKGFGFDIFPTDPDWCDENGQHMWADDDDDESDEDLLDDDDDEFDTDTLLGLDTDDQTPTDDSGGGWCDDEEETPW